jgi:hypothetical protein
MPSNSKSIANEFVIDIHPVPFVATDHNEQIKRAEALAKELRKLKGVTTIKVHRVSFRADVVSEANTPFLRAVIITTSGAILTAAVNRLVELLGEKQDNYDHRETVLIVQTSRYRLKTRNVARHKATIQRQIERHIKKIQKTKSQRSGLPGATI